MTPPRLVRQIIYPAKPGPPNLAHQTWLTKPGKLGRQTHALPASVMPVLVMPVLVMPVLVMPVLVMPLLAIPALAI